MARFIEQYRPPQGVLAAYKPVAPITAAVGVSTDLREH
jgi:hypothetical protein